MEESDLSRLACLTISLVKPHRGDSESADACWQTAYLAGLQIYRSCENKRRRPSRKYILLKMQHAVYQLLRQTVPIPVAICPDRVDRHDPLAAIDAKDFVENYLDLLTTQQRRTVLKYYSGETAHQIAIAEGVGYKAIHRRIKTALKLLRAAVGDSHA